jgi:tripartite-type tricarboxylate transporter receptor subunit TctC
MNKWLILLGIFTSHAAWGQAYPNKVVRLVNPYAAGGPTEAVARELANGLSQEFGQQVIVDSRPGGGTVIGADMVAKSAPDGYTLLAATVAPLIVQPAINNTLPYNATRDFVPVGLYATIPNLIAVFPGTPVKSLKELIDYARANPGKLNYASAGTGSGPHLGGELFKAMTGTQITHVPYKGAAPAVVDVIAGQVEVSFVNITPQVQHVKAGKLRALAIAGERRSALLPDVPTATEAGVPGYIAESWNGVVAPSATPRAVVEVLSATMRKVMAKPEVRAKMLAMGAEVTPMGPEEFAAYLKADEVRLLPIIRKLDMKLN